MAKLIFDIETVGEDFDAMDETTQEVLTRWIKKESASEEEYQIALEELKNGLGLSAVVGKIVVIGALNPETEKGVIYFQAPGAPEIQDEFEEGGITFKKRTEAEMLSDFWQAAKNYNEFVSFNGRSFDAPFLAARSAINKIRPTKDLMSNRYLNSQKFDAKHVDLLDQLTFYGAMRRKWSSLHLWCRAFGIKSPKSEGITGDDVGKLFKEKKYLEIAYYNAGDLYATKNLYEYWQEYMQF
jgi:3'-5' exonuclease